MKLSKRIYAICDKVSRGESVADIGTDHGYVPMILVREGISPRAIMSDISEGSLSKAIDTFRECNLDMPRDSFRVGDGLSTIKPQEVDDIIIAGLGGHTIASIIEEDMALSRSFKKLIMQPRKHSGYLRCFLYRNGFDIVSEDLSEEGKFVCEIITAVPSESSNRDIPWDEDDIRWKYPKEFTKVNNECTEKRIGWKIGAIDEEIDNLRTSKHDRTELIEELQRDRRYLVELLEANRTYWRINEEA